MALAHLVGELADAEDLLHAGRGVGDEVERAGERTDATDERDLARTAAGTRAASPRCSSPSRTGRGRAGGARTRAVWCRAPRPGRPWRPSRTRACACPARAREVGERGGDRRLADAALAGDEEQVAIEEIAVRRVASRVSRRSRCAGRRRRAELDVGDLGRRHADLAAPLVGEPQHVDRAGERGLDVRDGRRRCSSSGISTFSSRGAWVTPMRTSTTAAAYDAVGRVRRRSDRGGAERCRRGPCSPR